jgi:zinc protease
MKRRSGLLRVWLVLIVFVVASQSGRSQTEAADASARAGEAPKIAFEKYTLPNGLQVILHVDRKLPMVHVNSW